MVRLTAAHMAGNFLLKKKKRRTSIAQFNRLMLTQFDPLASIILFWGTGHHDGSF